MLFVHEFIFEHTFHVIYLTTKFSFEAWLQAPALLKVIYSILSPIMHLSISRENMKSKSMRSSIIQPATDPRDENSATTQALNVVNHWIAESLNTSEYFWSSLPWQASASYLVYTTSDPLQNGNTQSISTCCCQFWQLSWKEPPCSP